MPDTACYDSYDAVEIRLPNRPVIRCRALTMRWAMRFLRYMEQGKAGDAYATWQVFAQLPQAVTPRRWGWLPLKREYRKARRLLTRLRGQEVLKVLDLFFPEPPQLVKPTEREKQQDAKRTPPTMDDMIAEYAVLCGGPPDPELPYPLFVAIVGRRARFEARALLRAATATNWGSGMVKETPEVAKDKQYMAQMAYPGEKAPVVFALKQSDREKPDAG